MLNYKVLKRDDEKEIFQINVHEESKNIGIGENNPQATLDIKGDLRIQDIPTATSNTSNFKRLVVDDKGKIHCIAYDGEDEKQSNKTAEVTLEAGKSVDLPSPQNLKNIQIDLEFNYDDGKGKSLLKYNGTKLEIETDTSLPSFTYNDNNGIILSDISTNITVTNFSDYYNINITNNWIKIITVKYKITGL